MHRSDLDAIVVECLEALGGEGTIVEVAREIWLRYEAELRHSGDLFFTWQYDIRWSKTRLRDSGKVALGRLGNWSTWVLVNTTNNHS